MFYLTIEHNTLRHCHFWLAQQYFQDNFGEIVIETAHETYVVVDSLFIVAPIVYGVSVFGLCFIILKPATLVVYVCQF